MITLNSQLPIPASQNHEARSWELEVGQWELERPSGRDVAAPGTYGQATILDFHTDGMPTAVLVAAVRVTHVVLLAQFVGDARCRCVKAVKATDDFRPSTSVVGDLAQRLRIDPLAIGNAVIPA